MVAQHHTELASQVLKKWGVLVVSVQTGIYVEGKTVKVSCPTLVAKQAKSAFLNGPTVYYKSLSYTCKGTRRPPPPPLLFHSRKVYPPYYFTHNNFKIVCYRLELVPR